MAEPNYSLPSWLQTNPTDTAKNFVSGLQIGATLGEARNRLQQSANQAAMEAQTKSDSIAANALKEQQELAVQKEYQQTQAALKSQEIAAAQQKIGLATMQAARQFQAQQSFKKSVETYQPLVDSGKMTQDDAIRRAMIENVEMLGTGATAGSALSRLTAGQKKYEAPKVMTGPSGENVFWSPQSPHFQVGKPPTTAMDASKFQATPLTDTTGKVIPGKYTVPGPNATRRVITTSTKNPNDARIKELEDGLLGNALKSGVAPDPKYKALSAAYPAAKKEYDALKAGTTSTAPATTKAAPAASGERVKVISPDGATGTMLKSKWDQFQDDLIDQGWENVNE